jgi:hypothetical protein
MNILTSSKKSSVQKLVKLLSFAQIDKIVALFNAKTAPQIEHELRKLFSSKSLDTIRLGDFSSKFGEIKSDDDIESVALEFKEFLKSKKDGKKKIIFR